MLRSVLYQYCGIFDNKVHSLSPLGGCLCHDFWEVEGFGFYVPQCGTTFKRV